MDLVIVLDVDAVPVPAEQDVVRLARAGGVGGAAHAVLEADLGCGEIEGHKGPTFGGRAGARPLSYHEARNTRPVRRNVGLPNAAGRPGAWHLVTGRRGQ